MPPMLPPPDLLPEGAPRLSSDRYVLLAKVGKGGMAGVYGAWDVREQDWRAVKVLLPRFALDKGIRSRFQNEGVTMAQMSHPNLVRVFEIGSVTVSEGPALPFIVMELLNGGSLHRWVKTHGAMPPRLAVTAAIQLLQGLEVVHASGVVHRDVKPKNVLSDDASVLKLTDFGIAQLEASNETKTGLAMGTLGYMAPEQLHDAKSVDPRSDLYGVAATLWTLLTTQKPRDLFRIEDRPDLLKDVPEVLRGLLVRCLAYERNERPDSARAVADELRSILFSLPEDPPGTADLSLHLGMPDIRKVSAEAFSELSLTGASGGMFQGGNSGTDPYGSKLGAPLLPSDGRSKGPTPEPTPSRERTRRVGTVPEPEPPSLANAVEGLGPALGVPRSFAEQRQLSDERDEVPSWVVDEEPRPEPMPVTVAPAQAPARSRSRLAAIIGTLMLGAAGVMIGVGLGIVGYGAKGAAGVREAETTFHARGEELEREVSYLDTLPQELADIGADPAPVRAAWDGWKAAPPGTERTLQALQVVHLAMDSAAPKLPLGPERSHEQELVFQRLDRLRGHVGGTEVALREWQSAAEHPAAQLALALQFANPPPGGAE
jgi:serine/threonine protein kinase